jgi:hypothetical protein
MEETRAAEADLAKTKDAKTNSREDFNFQKDGRMNMLFDALNPTKTGFVDIAGFLNEAAKADDCARKLLSLCKRKIPHHEFRKRRKSSNDADDSTSSSDDTSHIDDR